MTRPTVLWRAVAALPDDDLALIPLLRIPADEIAALRADPDSADLMLRHRIAYALEVTMAHDEAALALGREVFAAAQADAQQEIGQLINQAIAERASPEEVKRRMFEYFTKLAGPEAVEKRVFGGA